MKPTMPRMLTPLTLCCLALVLAAGLGCDKKKIPLGAVLPLTGDDATYGQAVGRGVELALEELKADPATAKIEMPIRDSESNSEKAAQLFEELIRDGAVAVLGGVTTDEAQAMIQLADKFDRVLLSPSATEPELTASQNFFRICPSDFTAASKMANFAIRNLKAETVVVFAEERTYAKGVQEVFQSVYEDQGGEVLEVLEVPRHTSDLSGLLGRVQTLAPDAVYLAAYESVIGTLIQELRRINYQGKILTTSAFATPAAIARVGQDAEGVMLTMTYFELDSEHAHVQKFVRLFQEKYGQPPDIFAAHGYDATKVLAAAVEGRPPEPPEVYDGLRFDIVDFPGVTGSIKFNERGDVVKFPRVYIIGNDLALYDYNERVRQQKEALRKRREEIQRELDRIRREAREIGD